MKEEKKEWRDFRRESMIPYYGMKIKSLSLPYIVQYKGDIYIKYI